MQWAMNMSSRLHWRSQIKAKSNPAKPKRAVGLFTPQTLKSSRRGSVPCVSRMGLFGMMTARIHALSNENLFLVVKGAQQRVWISLCACAFWLPSQRQVALSSRSGDANELAHRIGEAVELLILFCHDLRCTIHEGLAKEPSCTASHHPLKVVWDVCLNRFPMSAHHHGPVARFWIKAAHWQGSTADFKTGTGASNGRGRVRVRSLENFDPSVQVRPRPTSPKILWVFDPFAGSGTHSIGFSIPPDTCQERFLTYCSKTCSHFCSESVHTFLVVPNAPNRAKMARLPLFVPQTPSRRDKIRSAGSVATCLPPYGTLKVGSFRGSVCFGFSRATKRWVNSERRDTGHSLTHGGHIPSKKFVPKSHSNIFIPSSLFPLTSPGCRKG